LKLYLKAMDVKDERGRHDIVFFGDKGDNTPPSCLSFSELGGKNKSKIARRGSRSEG